MNRKLRRAAAAKPQHAPDPLAEGVEHHRAGRLRDAEACYERLLATQPDHAHALYLRGVVAQQLGKTTLGLASLRGAVMRAPRNAIYLYNLGVALVEQNKFEDAIAMYRRAIEIQPDYAEAHGNLGQALSHIGEPEAAIAAFRQAIALKPNYAIAHANLSSALNDLGRHEEAEASSRRAIAIDPHFAAAHLNLGVALAALGHPQAQIDSYLRAIAIKPNYPAAHSNLGRAFADQGRHDEAIEAYRRAIAIEPDYAPAHYNLGAALNEIGAFDDAIACYRRGIGFEADSASARHDRVGLASAHCNVGVILFDRGRVEEAIVAYERAVEINPRNAQAWSNLANAQKDQGRLEEAIASYRRAIEIKPDLPVHYSNLALCLNYGDLPIAEEFEAHVNCNEPLRRSAPPPTAPAPIRGAGERLRIGYVSPDFRQHSVAYFFEPLLMAHDPRAVEVFCYADVKRPDATTGRLQARAEHWRDTVGLSDDDVAERVRADGVDILVDLAGHTAKNRLGVFARRPAPVQVTWLGYPNTTGLAAIDYRLVDDVTDPVGEADAWASERLFRLEGGFQCYRGAPDAPEPATPPSASGGAPTFGSFNNPAKLSPRLLDVWASLLRRLPESRLLLKGKPFADPATRELFLSRMSERGVASARVDLIGWLPNAAAHLDLYRRIDIALDPFPFNGATTTCEALWMGVPVVTLRGERHRGRVGASLLSRIGLTDWIADSGDEYEDIAIRFIGDARTLIELRGTLRARMRSSRLCDAAAFAREMEAAFRTMWRNGPGKADPDPRGLPPRS
jgi:predicted O-linked N-acetylglucosamine transferase (SPINDLY family)